MKITKFQRLTKPELEERELKYSIDLAGLEEKRDFYKGRDPKSGVPHAEDEHLGGRCGEAAHSLNMMILPLVSTIIQIRSRLAEIDFRGDMKKQNRSMFWLNITVAGMVLLQVLLSFGVIDKIADRVEEPPPVEKPDVDTTPTQ